MTLVEFVNENLVAPNKDSIIPISVGASIPSEIFQYGSLDSNNGPESAKRFILQGSFISKKEFQ